MELNPTLISMQGRLRQFAVMNPVVVENHMDDLDPGMMRHQFVQQGDEQAAALPFPFDPSQQPGTYVEGTSQVTFDVLPRRDHFLLLTAYHPIPADFGIQMNVDLVFIKRPLLARQRRQQSAECRKPAGLDYGTPRATYRRSCPTPSRLNQGQGPAHARYVYPDTGLPRQRLHQQFARPGWPTPAVPLRRPTHHVLQSRQVAFVQLDHAIVFARIQQPPFPMSTEAFGHTVDCGVMHAQNHGGLVGAAMVAQVDNDEVTHVQSRFVSLTQTFEQLLLDREAQPRNNVLHGNSSLGRVAPRTFELGEFPFSLFCPVSSRGLQLNRARSFRSEQRGVPVGTIFLRPAER